MASDKTNDLNAPDAFQVQAYSVMDKVAKNQKPMWAVSGAIALVLLGGFVWKEVNDSRKAKLQTEAAAVDMVFESEVKSYSQAREALDKQRDAIVAKLPTPAEGQAPAETPELKAINDQIKALKPDHAGSAAKYQEFYKANPKSAEGLVAGVKAAAHSAEKGDLDAAKAMLETIIADAKAYPILRAQALLLAISIHEDKGDFDAAIKLADDLVASAGPELLARALLTKGQAQYLKKDFAAAKTTLEKLVADHGASQEAERARGLLALIPAA